MLKDKRQGGCLQPACGYKGQIDHISELRPDPRRWPLAVHSVMVSFPPLRGSTEQAFINSWPTAGMPPPCGLWASSHFLLGDRVFCSSPRLWHHLLPCSHRTEADTEGALILSLSSMGQLPSDPRAHTFSSALPLPQPLPRAGYDLKCEAHLFKSPPLTGSHGAKETELSLPFKLILVHPRHGWAKGKEGSLASL